MKNIIFTLIILSCSFSAFAGQEKKAVKNKKAAVVQRQPASKPVKPWEPKAFMQFDYSHGTGTTWALDAGVHREFFTPGLTFGFKVTYLTPGNIQSLPTENYLLESRYYFNEANKGLYVMGGAGLGYISVPIQVRLGQDENKLADHVNLKFLSTEYGIGYAVEINELPMAFEFKNQTLNWNNYHENYYMLSVGVSAF